MEFQTLPPGVLGQQELRLLAQRLHDLGPHASQGFIAALLAGHMPTSSMILRALQHPARFDGANEYAELPPVLQPLAGRDGKRPGGRPEPQQPSPAEQTP